MPEKTVEVIAKVNPQTYEPLLGDCTLHVGESDKIEFRRGRAMVPVSVARLLVDRRSDIDIPALGYTGGAATAPQAATPTGTLETQADHEHVGPPAGMDESDLQAAAAAIKQADPSDLQALIALGKRAEEEVEDRRREDAHAAGTRHAPADRPDTAGIDTKQASRAAAGPLADPDGSVRSKPARTDEQVESESETEPTGGPEQEAEEPVSPQVAAAMEHLAGEELEEARVEQVEPEVAKTEEPETPEPESESAADSPQATRVIPPGFEAQTAEGEPRCLALTAANNQCHNAAVDGGPACKLDRHQEQFAA